MKALWIEKGKLYLREDLSEPVPEQGEALIKPILSGICGTDIQLLQGYYDFSGIPGHEFVGEVVQAPGNENWIGKRVVGEINIGCGQCPACESNKRNHCEKRKVLGIKGKAGVFAERFTLPVSNLHSVPDCIANEDAVFCEPLAAILRIKEQVSIDTDSSVLIIGAGKLGLLTVLAMRDRCDDMCVVAHYQHQQQLLANNDIAFLPHISNNHRQWDVVIDTSGNPSGLTDALTAVKPLGEIVVKTSFREAHKVNLSRLVIDEIRITGSRCGPFSPAIKTLAEGLKPSILISREFSFSEAEKAMVTARQKGINKIVLRY